MKKFYEWQHQGRESLQLDIEINGENITSVKMKARGCLSFLQMSQKMKAQLKGPKMELSTPDGNDHSSLIWKEIILKIKEKWQDPVNQEELCHCRKVTTNTVDRSIVYGATSVGEVRKRTSANTGCGTCLSDVEALIKNRITE